MSTQQTKQKCQLSPKCPPKCPLPGPQAPALCLPPRAPVPCLPPRGPPASSCCISTCCISGFGGRCSLVSHRFPRFYLRQPRRSDCPENESPGCSSCCHSSGNCS
ncbi:late cornified envelope protein 7A [Microtus pennsylvanicus]|uniref:late cornified envelope protein 7A n=1 Tax=Microtus pennsylvanicus TaxID=10058 RepID=UPI003F6AA998